jgi:hypothetical protein
MEAIPRFAGVEAFGKALQPGVHEFPLNTNTNGPCPPGLEDWTLIVRYDSSLTVRVRGVVKMRGSEFPTVPEAPVLDCPMRIKWSTCQAVVFRTSGNNGTLTLHISLSEPHEDQPPGNQSTAEGAE